MKLSSLLTKHSATTHKSEIIGNFGDSYLLQNNYIYRKIRLKTLALSYMFSDDISPDYLAFPMAQLESVLNNKKIPYINNVRPLIKLNEQTSSILDWDHVVDNIKPNYLFHESCHAVARSFSFKTQNVQTQILVTLLEESFANNCEFLAIKDAQDSAHLTFLEMNSYFTVFEDRTHLKKAVEKYGLTSIFKLMLLSYLHSNFLNDDIDETTFKKIIELSGFNSNPELKVLKSLSENAFALNPRFRYTTTEMYLRLQGIQTPVTEALSFDYLQQVTTDSNLTYMITQLANFIGTEHE